jgi:hypothetical protein
MEKDLSQAEKMLQRNERDIQAIDDDIEGLEGTIAGMHAEILKLRKEKEICMDLSVSLKVRLGQIEPPAKPAAGSVAVEDDGRPFVLPKNFVKGLSPADGGLKILTKWGKPMSHTEMVQHLLKGGVRSEAKSSDVAFRTALGRRKEFLWIKLDGSRGVWVLRDWPGYENYEKPKKIQKVEQPESRPALALVSESEPALSAGAQR